jgi:hypothetical protein
LVRVDEPAAGDREGGASGVRGARLRGAAGVNAARVTVRAWTLDLRDALGELGAARLRWCLMCGRVGLWGWRPLTPSMPITWLCTNTVGCQRRRAAVAVRAWGGWRRLVA